MFYTGITGNPNVGFTAKDLEGDFDPDSYDAVMATAFSDDYYAMEEKEEEDEEKPVFSEEGEYQSYFSNCNLICVLMCLNIISSWLVSSLSSSNLLCSSEDCVDWDQWQTEDLEPHCEDQDFNVRVFLCQL